MFEAVTVTGIRTAGGQQRDQGDQRDGRDVLKQQNGEREATVRRALREFYEAEARADIGRSGTPLAAAYFLMK